MLKKLLFMAICVCCAWTVFAHARVDSYGPVDGYPALSLESSPLTAAHLAWRGKWRDVTGLYYWGARPYDPERRAFISSDPFGHSADDSLYYAFDGQPTVYWDPDGRFGKAAVQFEYQGGMQSIQSRQMADYFNNINTTSPTLAWLSGAAGGLANEAAEASAPSFYVNGLTGFGRNVHTIYNESGFLPAASYSISGWNVGKIYSGFANLNLVTGQPVGDWYQRGEFISSGVANTAGIAAGGLWGATKLGIVPPTVPPVIAPPETPSGLVHLTDRAGAAGINQSGSIVGRRGIFAVPETVEAESTVAKVARTGLTPARTTEAVPIPSAANTLFQRPIPIGPYSGWKYLGGVRYAPPGAINTATGAFTPMSSVIGPGTLIYGPDVLFWGGVGTAAGLSIYSGGGQ
ncbi:MAG: hypothetical protein KGR98_09040 [Verrucomicrobia bacterium]|nr:hypothetical protein [Verrucomicrobiota bacterium]MDE3099475.1 hypothetical protein [Verrucomicrobiota bacterium]